MIYSRRELMLAGLEAIPALGTFSIDLVPASVQTTPKSPRYLRQLRKIITEHTAWLNNPKIGRRANLAGVDLSGISFDRANLRCALFDGANLTGAEFINVDLGRASFVECRLADAKLLRCHLVGANFTGAVMTRSVIDCYSVEENGCRKVANADAICCSQADLRHSVLKIAIESGDFSNADLSHADISHSCLDASSADSISLCDAKLDYVTAHRSNFMLVAFRQASFVSANFDGSSILSCSMADADLAGVSMVGTRLVGNNLRQTKWRNADLRCAFFASNYYLTSHSVPPYDEPNEMIKSEGAVFEEIEIPWTSGPVPYRSWEI